jgi:glycosyltransferase involved in cell wall biosynthesis
MEAMVSIITPSYNKEKFIGATIESVLSQTYSLFEFIIIDDFSSDKSCEVIEAYANTDPRIKLIRHQAHSGASFCRNDGIKISAGSYIIFLDADDILEKNCLLNRVQEMEKEKDLDFCVFTMGTFRHSIGDFKGKWEPRSASPLDDFLRHDLPWSILQPIWKRDVVLRVGGFDPSFKRFQDIEFHVRVLLLNGILFKQFSGPCDSYYRISEERRNYDTFTFNLIRVQSCFLFYNKFFSVTKARNSASLLFGAFYETFVQIVFHTRHGMLRKDEFRTLQQKLLDPVNLPSLKPYRKFCFKITYLYQYYLPRIPGINLLLKRLVTM